MPQPRSTARIMVTDWHSILLLLVSLWSVVYPFLDPAHFQLQNAIDSLALALIALVFAHAHASLKQQNLAAGIGDTRPVQVPPRASRDH